MMYGALKYRRAGNTDERQLIMRRTRFGAELGEEHWDRQLESACSGAHEVSTKVPT
jgi:hypothetical protein